MNEQAVRGMLGLAMRAGQLTTGVDLAARLMREGKAAAALIDSGASDNAKKRIGDTATFYHVPVFVLPEGMMDEATGKSGRVAVALQKGALAGKIILLLTTAE